MSELGPDQAGQRGGTEVVSKKAKRKKYNNRLPTNRAQPAIPSRLNQMATPEDVRDKESVAESVASNTPQTEQLEVNAEGKKFSTKAEETARQDLTDL